MLTCPNCRQLTPVPASGVAGLQAAFQINQLLEIVEEHKKALATDSKAAGASMSSTPHGNTIIGYPDHDGREVELYCETCGKTICYKCIKKAEKHHTHDYEEINEAFVRYQREIVSSLEPMEKQLMAIKEALGQFDACHMEISEQRVAIKGDINKTITTKHWRFSGLANLTNLLRPNLRALQSREIS